MRRSCSDLSKTDHDFSPHTTLFMYKAEIQIQKQYILKHGILEISFVAAFLLCFRDIFVHIDGAAFVISSAGTLK